MNAPYTIIACYLENYATDAYGGRVWYFSHNRDISHVSGKEQGQGNNIAKHLVRLFEDKGKPVTKDALVAIFNAMMFSLPDYWKGSHTLAKIYGSIDEILQRTEQKVLAAREKKESLSEFVERNGL